MTRDEVFNLLCAIPASGATRGAITSRQAAHGSVESNRILRVLESKGLLAPLKGDSNLWRKTLAGYIWTQLELVVRTGDADHLDIHRDVMLRNRYMNFTFEEMQAAIETLGDVGLVRLDFYPISPVASGGEVHGGRIHPTDTDPFDVSGWRFEGDGL